MMKFFSIKMPIKFLSFVYFIIQFITACVGVLISNTIFNIIDKLKDKELSKSVKS